ncbi:MAG: rRNA maturation RNase YbeY [Chitinophagaceae bacterium]|nr:rRNA maturation RNase YbeY [Chitinophagaceae bacterium]
MAKVSLHINKPSILATRNKKHFFFNFHQVPRIPKESLPTQSLLDSVMIEEGAEVERVDYIFCVDAYLIELNRAYLNHNTFTDILTFTLSPVGEAITSEIYISVERVRENAGKYGVSFETELHRVMIHGLLHLCGYEDGTPKQKKHMRSKEDYYLGKR